MELKPSQNFCEKFCYVCTSKKCKLRKSVRYDTPFNDKKLTLRKIYKIFSYCAASVPKSIVSQIMTETSNSNTIREYYRFSLI